MAYMYKLKDPRGKLRQIVLEYQRKMRVMGFVPNREITFCDCVPGRPGESVGWLLDDPRVENVHQRYVLLQDGDVWHESLGGSANGGPPSSGDKQWLGEPTDDLTTLLPKSLMDAQRGGGGFLSDEGERADAPLVVADRRDRQEPFDGANRRRS